MQKVIGRYSEATFKETYQNRYRKWKFGKPKHIYYVRNRRSSHKILDTYDQYILNNLVSGKTVTYDAAGYYLDGIVDDLSVIELNPIVQSWFPAAYIDSGNDSLRSLYGQADNFIVNNTIKLRWKTFDEYTDYWKIQRRFLKSGSQVFFSFRDIFIFHNRLKYNFSVLLQQWVQSMEQYGYYPVKISHDLIKINDTIDCLSHLPEIDDMVNGNIKIHWKYQP
jgi:hypothetical protein